MDIIKKDSMLHLLLRLRGGSDSEDEDEEIRKGFSKKECQKLG